MKKITLLILLIFIVSCAVQGPIPGGDIDKKGPNLLSVQPSNYSTDINSTQKFILFFDESLEPNSVYKSLKIDNSEFKVTIIGKRIIIKPKDEWNTESILNINLSRELNDYYKNSIDRPINLFFSFGELIPRGLIKGKILDINNFLKDYIGDSLESDMYEVGLCKINESERVIIQKTQTDKNFEFSFNALGDGVYSIIAVDQIILNPNNDISKKRFSILNSDLTINENNLEHNILLNIGEPISRKNISSINFINQYYVNYDFTDGTSQLGIIDSIYNNFDNNFSGSKLQIFFEFENQFEKYRTNPFEFVVPSIIDSVSPYINSCELQNLNMLLNISEPLDNSPLDSIFYFYSDANFNKTYINNVEYKLETLSISPSGIILPITSEIHSDSAIYIMPNSIKDLSGNYINDSIVFINQCINVVDTEDQVEFGYGGLFGEINTNNKNKLIVVTYNALTGESKRTIATDNKFSFKMLSPGEYFLQVYSNYQLDSEIIYPYFPGKWDPFQHSVSFSEIVGPIEVRRNWDIEGISINFK